MPTQLPAVPTAVYCHALWRTGSTSIFNAFRADDRFMCFYEPLHEGLRTLTPKKADRFNPQDIQRMGHSGLTRPYFAEYRKLVARRQGVPAFPSHLSYGQFFDVGSTGRAELKCYFDLLAHFAQAHKKVPVFCLNRSWGRMSAFRDIAPEAVHVFSLRNPLATWLSLKERRSYFFAKFLRIFLEFDPGRMEDDFPEIADLSLLERIRIDRTLKRKVAEISDDRFGPLFWEVYVSALLNGVLHADFILDLDQSGQGLDDRVALGQYLSILPGALDGAPLTYRLNALATHASGRGTYSDGSVLPPVPYRAVRRHVDALFEDGARLRSSVSFAKPKLSDANRLLLRSLIASEEEKLVRCL